jgi:MinD-like ATPase involved in chromosome partitioning or flagellar assembly
MSVFVTFHAYKGGTGRTLALVHTAWALAREGRRVVLLDLDLMAPSLWSLFGTGEAADGFVELVADWQEGKAPSVEPYLRRMPLDARASGTLHVMGAGRLDERYFTTLEGLDWQWLLDAQRGPAASESFLEFLRKQLTEHLAADIIFIDSPSGLSETSNVCLRLLADVVALFFVPTHVQLEGVSRVVGLLTAEQQALRAAGSARVPDVFCVASNLLRQQDNGSGSRRIQEAFRFLERVRLDALAGAEVTEELITRVRQPPVIIPYDAELATLEKVDTTQVPTGARMAVYEDVLRCLVQSISSRQPLLTAREKPVGGE